MQRRLLWAHKVATIQPDAPDQLAALADHNGEVESSSNLWIYVPTYGLLLVSLLFVFYHLWRFFPLYRRVFAEIRLWLQQPEYRTNITLSLRIEGESIVETNDHPLAIRLPPQVENIEMLEDCENQSDCSSSSFTSC